MMTWATYGEFLAFATVLVLIPGPDFAVVTKNTLAGGRRDQFQHRSGHRRCVGPVRADRPRPAGVPGDQVGRRRLPRLPRRAGDQVRDPGPVPAAGRRRARDGG